MAVQKGSIEVPLNKITVGPRYRKDMGDMQEFVASIKEHGILQPITIDSNYLLVTGGRRYAGAKQAGLSTIPCLIRKITGKLNYLELELLENKQRKDMTWQEQARLEKDIFELRLKEDPNWSLRKQEELTDASKASIQRRIELARAIDLVPGLAVNPSAEQAWKQYTRLQEDVVVESLAQNAKGKYKELERFASDHYNIGDAFAGVKSLNPGVYHFAEVDPPYAIELEKRKARNKVSNTKVYREVAEEDYGQFCKDMARLVYRALRPNSFCVWWYAAEWDAVVKELLEEAGFAVSPIPAIWYKGQAGLPPTSRSSCAVRECQNLGRLEDLTYLSLRPWLHSERSIRLSVLLS